MLELIFCFIFGLNCEQNATTIEDYDWMDCTQLNQEYRHRHIELSDKNNDNIPDGYEFLHSHIKRHCNFLHPIGHIQND